MSLGQLLLQKAPESFPELFLHILFSLALYAISLFGTGALTREDARWMRGVLRR